MKAMLFAAGLGTRLKPLTDRIPKALVPIAGRTLLEHTLNKLKKAGVEEVVVNVHHLGEQIIDFIATHDFGMQIHISDERDALLDTGGGLRRAACFLQNAKDTILLHNVDILSNADLGFFCESAKDYPVMLLVSERSTSRYLLFDEEMNLKGWTNLETGEVRSPYKNLDVKNLRKLAFSGIHAVSPSIFSNMNSYPEKFPIMDFYLSECNQIKIKGFIAEGLQLVDVGKYATLQSAEDFVLRNGLLVEQ